MLKKQKGLTIIQLMLLLLVAGIAGSLMLRTIIEFRCHTAPAEPMCIKHPA